MYTTTSTGLCFIPFGGGIRPKYCTVCSARAIKIAPGSQSPRCRACSHTDEVNARMSLSLLNDDRSPLVRHAHEIVQCFAHGARDLLDVCAPRMRLASARLKHLVDQHYLQPSSVQKLRVCCASAGLPYVWFPADACRAAALRLHARSLRYSYPDERRYYSFSATCTIMRGAWGSDNWCEEERAKHFFHATRISHEKLGDYSVPKHPACVYPEWSRGTWDYRDVVCGQRTPEALYDYPTAQRVFQESAAGRELRTNADREKCYRGVQRSNPRLPARPDRVYHEWNGWADFQTLLPKTSASGSLRPLRVIVAGWKDGIRTHLLNVPPCVAEIGPGGFQGSVELTHVVLPPSMSKLCRHAFAGCELLSVVRGVGAVDYIGPSAFSDCIDYGQHSALVLNAHTVESDAFRGCNLSWVELPRATDVGIGAFRCNLSLRVLSAKVVRHVPPRVCSGCEQLSTVWLSSATSIGVEAFAGCAGLRELSVPNAQTAYKAAFMGTGIREVTRSTFPALEFIGDACFSCCADLEIVFCNLRDIGSHAFCNCTHLRQVVLPLIGTISPYAFSYSRKLCDVVLPSVGEIGPYAFERSGIASVGAHNIPSLACVCEGAFRHSRIEDLSCPHMTACHKFALQGCLKLTRVSAPMLEFISEGMCLGCSALRTVEAAPQRIGASAFRSCASLTRIDLRRTRTVLRCAFLNCRQLRDIDLQSATHIGKHAYEGCISVKGDLVMTKLVHVNDFAFWNTGVARVVHAPNTSSCPNSFPCVATAAKKTE